MANVSISSDGKVDEQRVKFIGTWLGKLQEEKWLPMKVVAPVELAEALRTLFSFPR